MGTLFFVLVFVAFLVWLGKAWRRRELQKFRDVDSSLLQELRQDHPSEIGSTPAQVESNSPEESPKAKHIPLNADVDTRLADVSLAQVHAQNIEQRPITLRAIVLDNRERAMLVALESLVTSDYRVFVHLPIAEIVTSTVSERVTFAICHRHYFTFELAVEFRDAQSEVVSELLTSVSKPLILVESEETQVSLKKRLVDVHPSLVVEDSGKHRCPNCYSDMKLRAPSSGKNAGRRYWLCKSYPRCRGVITL